jgi:hypothetical protein
MTRKLVPFLLFLIALPAAASVDYFLSVTTSASPVDPGALARRVIHFPQTNLSNPSGDLPFTLNIPDDLRGRTIQGQTFYYEFADGIPLDSSELSAAVVVH